MAEQALLSAVREELGQKYYDLVQKRPDLKSDLLFPKVDESINLSRLSHVSISKKKDNGAIELVVTIDGDRQEKREIDSKYWQRFWLVDDKTGFKMAVAAKIFETELLHGFREVQALDTGNREEVEEEEVSATAEESVEQEEKAQRKGGRHM